LPDGAALFKEGFEKKRLKETNMEYLNWFMRETCRAELTHWIVFLFGPLFFIWNLWWVGIVMILYASLANMPCIITQRYNRIRLRRISRYHRQ
jgi:glycosyl-4,4'-diaponeurosporenoate acyltransferase